MRRWRASATARSALGTPPRTKRDSRFSARVLSALAQTACAEAIFWVNSQSGLLLPVPTPCRFPSSEAEDGGEAAEIMRGCLPAPGGGLHSFFSEAVFTKPFFVEALLTQLLFDGSLGAGRQFVGEA